MNEMVLVRDYKRDNKAKLWITKNSIEWKNWLDTPIKIKEKSPNTIIIGTSSDPPRGENYKPDYQIDKISPNRGKIIKEIYENHFGGKK